MDPLDFDAIFLSLTGNNPFPWQRALYERFVRGDYPSGCNLPTGLGKTAVIPIWLIALAQAPNKVPRRLVYVVNRRTVVDQATTEAERVRDNLASRSDLREALQRLCATQPDAPLAISTLRGQRAETDEWRADPTRPAVVVGTVDLIGSRLLFQGYRAGFKRRPLLAGFLGQDALIVHDEAHLEPAFQRLIEAIQEEQGRCGDLRRLKVVELSATSRSGGEPFGLKPEDRDNATVRQRLDAPKQLCFHEVDDPQAADRIVELAKAHEGSGLAILIFARTVDAVGKIQKKLPAKQTLPLTGTMRGYERDGLVRHPIFVRFLPGSKLPAQEGTVYLVCTSAGEVGVNISADHLVSDLTPFDSMAQRFGRVNRFGQRTDTRIDIVHPSEFDEDEQPRQRTLTLLRQLTDASPSKLSELPAADRREAFSPQPTVLPTTDILFDNWAMTTIRGPLPGRPPVADWLHGLSGSDPPRTQVAWREEVWILRGSRWHDEFDPRELLADYPLKPHELLSDVTSRVVNELTRLEAPPETPIWIVHPDEKVDRTTLGELPGWREDLGGRIVLLPPQAGGLTATGFLDASSAVANDVSGALVEDGIPLRTRLRDDEPVSDGLRCVRTLDLRTDGEEDDGEPSGFVWRWYAQPRTADDDGSKAALVKQYLPPHLDQVGKLAGLFAERLGLTDLVRVFELAGRWHDLGKRRKVWQRYIRNDKYPDEVLAKPRGASAGRLEERYRHEFGSLLDLVDRPDFKTLTPEQQDLLLHLVAAHHGRARPHFPAEEAFDPERKADDADRLAREVPRRFARLQRKYGRWGLAFLESLLRAADAHASEYPEEGGPS